MTKPSHDARFQRKGERWEATPVGRVQGRLLTKAVARWFGIQSNEEFASHPHARKALACVASVAGYDIPASARLARLPETVVWNLVKDYKRRQGVPGQPGLTMGRVNDLVREAVGWRQFVPRHREEQS